jgi:hypothetical protein
LEGARVGPPRLTSELARIAPIHSQSHAARHRPRIANDDGRNAKLLQRYVFDIDRPARWLGQIIAYSADEAIEAAAVAFSADIKKLIAVPIYEVA